jgi:hypothetical protein
VLGRGGGGLGGPAREQARVGVGAEGQDEHCGGRGRRLPRRGGLEPQQLQRLGGEADLLPDGAREEDGRRPAHPASAFVEQQLPAAAAEVDAARGGGRCAVERGDRGRRREAHFGREEVRDAEPRLVEEEARLAGERGRQRAGGQVERQNAARRRRGAADRGVAQDEEGSGRGAMRFSARASAGGGAEQDEEEEERHAFGAARARTGSWRSRRGRNGIVLATVRWVLVLASLVEAKERVSQHICTNTPEVEEKCRERSRCRAVQCRCGISESLTPSLLCHLPPRTSPPHAEGGEEEARRLEIGPQIRFGLSIGEVSESVSDAMPLLIPTSLFSFFSWRISCGMD